MHFKHFSVQTDSCLSENYAGILFWSAKEQELQGGLEVKLEGRMTEVVGSTPSTLESYKVDLVGLKRRAGVQ